MEGSTFDLRRMISPIEPDRFKRRYWEKQPFIIRRGKPDYYHDLLTLADVDCILSASSIRAPQIRLVREGKEIPLERLTADWLMGLARVLESLYAEYRGGATIVLQFLHERWKPLSALCRTLAQEFSACFQVNAYLTPANERGLYTHFDTHDVFVLQVHGSKHWRLYKQDPIELPLPDQSYDSRTMRPGDIREEFDLCSGDFLYVPRGCMHDAVSRNGTSLHLTVGVTTITWAALMVRAVESAIERNARLRESLPLGFAHNEDLRKSAEARLTQLVEALVSQIEPALVIEDAVHEGLIASRPELEGHLLDLESLPRLDLNTRLRRRPAVHWKIENDGGQIGLCFHGKRLSLPAARESDLRFMLDASDFSATELPGGLDDAGKLSLVQGLIREGFLAVTDPVSSTAQTEALKAEGQGR